MNIIIIITNDCKLSNSVLTNICIEQESCGSFKPIRSALIHGICLFEDGIGVARRRPQRAPSFRRTQAPFASTTTSCSCSPWFFVLLFPHDKNFAFIFDMQALVRLFLPCGSPCVRSTSDCAVLLRSWRTKDGGIMSELSLSMRVPIVSPANDG